MGRSTNVRLAPGDWERSERLTADPNAAWKAVWRARIVPLAAGLRGTVGERAAHSQVPAHGLAPVRVLPGGGPSQPFARQGAPARQAAAAGFAAWPFIDSLNPAADIRAGASVEVDLSPIELGQRITVKWRGKPVFIDHRTQAEIERAQADDAADLIDPALDSERVKREEWLVVIGICTHLGCVPLGQKAGDPRGKYGGYFCACHGSLYDTAGRVRKGPAPKNRYLPPYEFVDESTIRIA
jgi:ubiquinol-cytochrome c reductase iron-sulfur subunit